MKGESRPSRVNRDEPQLPASNVLDPPRGLTGAGRAEWIRLMPLLVDAGVISDGDLGHFADYCQAMSDLQRYQKKAARVGLEQAIAKGFAGQVLKLRTQLTQMRSHLGLTPSSRSGVHATRKPSSNLSKFLQRVPLGGPTNKQRFFGNG